MTVSIANVSIAQRVNRKAVAIMSLDLEATERRFISNAAQGCGALFRSVFYSKWATSRVNGPRALPAPTRISPAPTTKQKHHDKNDQ